MTKAMRHGIFALAFIPAAGSGLSGCVIAPDESERSDDGEEVAEVQQAYGESTCLTVPPDATNSEILDEGERGTTHMSGSAYGSSQCTNAFVVEYTPSQLPVDVLARAAWGNAGIATQVECLLGSVKFQLHTYASGVWTPRGEVQLFGTWNSALSRCIWSPDTGDMPYLEVLSGVGITKYRVTAQAYTSLCTFVGCSRSYYPVSVRATGKRPPG